jgi:hypothetical protein
VDVSDSDKKEMPAQRDAALPTVSLSVGRPFLAGTIGKAGTEVIAFKDRALAEADVPAVQAQLRLVESLPPDVQGTAVSQQIWETALWLKSQGGGWMVAATDGMDDYAPRLAPPTRDQATMFQGIRVLLLGTRQDHPRVEGLLQAAGAQVIILRDPRQFAAGVEGFMGIRHNPWGGRLFWSGLILLLVAAAAGAWLVRCMWPEQELPEPAPEPARRWVGLQIGGSTQGGSAEGGYLRAGCSLAFSNDLPSGRRPVSPTHGELGLPGTEPAMRLLFERDGEAVTLQNLCAQPLVVLHNEEPVRVPCRASMTVTDGDCIWAPTIGGLLEWPIIVADSAPVTEFYPEPENGFQNEFQPDTVMPGGLTAINYLERR